MSSVSSQQYPESSIQVLWFRGFAVSLSSKNPNSIAGPRGLTEGLRVFWFVISAYVGSGRTVQTYSLELVTGSATES